MMRRFFCLFIFLFSLPALARSQDVQHLLSEARKAEAALQEEEAFQRYRQVLQLEPANLAALCKSSELASKLGHRLKNQAEQHSRYEQAMQYAKKAIQLYPHSADANFVMSVALGRMALVSSGGEMIGMVKEIKKYAENVVRLNPADFRGYHVLGKWNYEISGLGAFKRTAVRIFYGAFPEASFQLAAKNYETSLKLNPQFNLNYLELAKVYLKLDQQEKAVKLLETLRHLPYKMSDDARVRAESLELLNSLK